MISSVRAANVILERAALAGQSLTPLQVMKLVYMAHGNHLAAYDLPLFPDKVQAWQYGPVIPSLYHHTKQFGNRAIQPPRLQLTIFDRFEPNAGEVWALNATYDTYGQYSGPALSNLTHRPGSPWSKVWRPGVASLVIPDSVIAQHYKEARDKGVLESA